MLAFLLIAFLASSPTLTPAQVAERAEASVIRIFRTVQDAEGKDQTQTCTAWMIDAARGWLITARHCVSPEWEGTSVRDKEGVEHPVLHVNPQFAILETERMSMPPLNLRKKNAEQGERVISVGYPYTFKYTLLVRHIAVYEGGDVITDGPLASGMSGGPTLDERGEVVGLNQMADSVFGGLCGVEEIRDFLKWAMKKSR